MHANVSRAAARCTAGGRGQIVVIEVEPEPSEDNEEFYAADFEEDYRQGYHDEDNEDLKDEHDRDKSPTGSEDEAPRLCRQKVMLEVDGELRTVHTLYDWDPSSPW
jgi:hypothetical protein